MSEELFRYKGRALYFISISIPSPIRAASRLECTQDSSSNFPIENLVKHFRYTLSLALLKHASCLKSMFSLAKKIKHLKTEIRTIQFLTISILIYKVSCIPFPTI